MATVEVQVDGGTVVVKLPPGVVVVQFGVVSVLNLQDFVYEMAFAGSASFAC